MKIFVLVLLCVYSGLALRLTTPRFEHPVSEDDQELAGLALADVHYFWNPAYESAVAHGIGKTAPEDSEDDQELAGFTVFDFHRSAWKRAHQGKALLPNETGLEDSTKEMEKYVLSQIEEAKLNGHKIHLQATCYSYSGVDTASGNSKPLSLLQYNHFFVDPGRMTVTVQPGVRYTDMVKEMKKHKVSLPSHGAYGGQTVIGAISTGTHGAGLPALHNSVLELKVVNGNGEPKTITSNDPEFGAWVNSVGSLGAILEATIAVVPEFNVRKIVTRQTLNKSLDHLLNDPKHYSDDIAVSDRGVAVFRSTVTEAQNVARHECCFVAFPKRPEVLSYVDDLAWPSMLDPPKATDGVCHRQGNADVWVTPGWKFGDTAFGAANELSVPVKDFWKSLNIFKTQPSSVRKSYQIRRITQDTTENVLLSPYYDGDRISFDIAGPGGSKSQTNKFQSFNEAFDKFAQKLTDEGIEVRYHIGKNQGTPFWSKTRADEFLVHKKANDNNNIFTNKFLQRIKVASQGLLLSEDIF